MGMLKIAQSLVGAPSRGAYVVRREMRPSTSCAPGVVGARQFIVSGSVRHQRHVECAQYFILAQLAGACAATHRYLNPPQKLLFCRTNVHEYFGAVNTLL